ncbi:MAG TPA: protein kinase [Bryobacteraceae bacterium]|jgi:serine/threonine protein kinase
MNDEVRELFHELADLSLSARERVFKDRGTGPEARSEVESLLRFDSAEDLSLTEPVSEAAEHLLASVDTVQGSHCGPYKLIRLIGSGGMGTVYLAERSDGEIRRTVAIKLLRPDGPRRPNHERFLKERQFLASLKHPSIVQLIDAGRMESGRPYLVMEYVEGVPIDVYADGITIRQRLELFVAVCDGVSHAHGHLIIHRDLKPSNVLVDASGRPKLLDFGIAKLLDETEEGATQTIERLLTPGYASPEQFRGELQTTATDVYSLGALLYKLVTGRSPHEAGASPVEVMLGRAAVPLASRSNKSLPRDIDAIVAKALRQEPEARYVSVEAFAGDVRAFLDSKPVEARSGNGWYRTRKFLRRYRPSVAAAALVFASLSAGLYVANRQRVVAERRFAQLRHLSTQVLDIDPELANLPGATAARIKLVATTKEYLEGLGDDAIGDQALASEVVAAYFRVARIQGVPLGYHLGQYGEAEKSLQKADSLVLQILSKDPVNRKALRQAGTIAHDRALIADAEGRPADEIKRSIESAQRWGRLTALGNLTKAEINNAAYVFANLAEIHLGLNRFDDALGYARRGVEVARLSDAIPGPRAQAHSLLASSLLYTGDLDGAMENAREARNLVNRGSFDNQRYRTQISILVYVHQGQIFGEEGGINLNRPVEAAAAFRQAFDLAEELAKKEAKDTYIRTWVMTAGRTLGDILRHTEPRQAPGEPLPLRRTPAPPFPNRPRLCCS